MANSDSEHEPEETVADLSNPAVATKYRTCGDIVNATLKQLVEACVEGADVAVLCQMGDDSILEKTAAVFNKKEKGRKLDKGIAFPTCVSVNEVCAHYCPFPGESKLLAKGDVVKVDVGAHIDGFITVAAHTVVVGGTDDVKGKTADVIVAAWTAAQCALRTIKVGGSNMEVTRVMNKAVAEYKCNTVVGLLSHQMKKYVIDGNRVIISKESLEEKVEEFQFGLHEVYALDVMVSTGEGKPKESDLKATVYKRDPEKKYVLKTALARQFIGEVDKRFSVLPFSVRAITDEKSRRLGVSECMRHELLNPYPVLAEKQGEVVAHFKMTVLLLPGGTLQICGLPFDESIVSEHSVKDEELVALLATPVGGKKQKKKSAKETEEL